MFWSTLHNLLNYFVKSSLCAGHCTMAYCRRNKKKHLEMISALLEFTKWTEEAQSYLYSNPSSNNCWLFICNQGSLATENHFFSWVYGNWTEVENVIYFNETIYSYATVSCVNQANKGRKPYFWNCLLLISVHHFSAPTRKKKWRFCYWVLFCFYIILQPGQKISIIILELLKQLGTMLLTMGKRNLFQLTRKSLFFFCL